MADPPLHHGISAEESHLEDSGIFDRVSFEGAGLPHGSVAEVLNHLDIIVLNQTVEACLSAAAVLRYASRSCCLVFARRDNLVDIDVSTWTGSKSVLLVGMEQALSLIHI